MDLTYEGVNIVIWTSVEVYSCLLCASLPACKLLVAPMMQKLTWRNSRFFKDQKNLVIPFPNNRSAVRSVAIENSDDQRIMSSNDSAQIWTATNLQSEGTRKSGEHGRLPIFSNVMSRRSADSAADGNIALLLEHIHKIQSQLVLPPPLVAVLPSINDFRKSNIGIGH